MQIESVIAALLCTVCCILLLISFQSATKRFLHVAIILPGGGKLNSYLEIWILVSRVINSNMFTNKYVIKKSNSPEYYFVLTFTKYFFFFITKSWFFVALYESVLIGRTSKANANFTGNYSDEVEQELKFPYSILLAGIGMLFAAIGWILSIVMYFKLQKQESQSMQDLDLPEAAIVLRNYDDIEAADTLNIRSQAGSWFKRV